MKISLTKESCLGSYRLPLLSVYTKYIVYVLLISLYAAAEIFSFRNRHRRLPTIICKIVGGVLSDVITVCVLTMEKDNLTCRRLYLLNDGRRH